jgi:phosphate transport system permease protein
MAALIASVPLVFGDLHAVRGRRLPPELGDTDRPAALRLRSRAAALATPSFGTVVMVGLATLISVPFGILAAVYLAILEPDSRWPIPCAFWPKC